MAELVGLLASILQLVDTIVKASTYVKDFQDAPKEQQKLLSEVQSLQPLLQELQSRVRDNQTASGIQQLKDPLARFEETMKRFSDKLRAASGPWSKVSKQLTWTLWNKKEASEELNKIERFKSLVNAWLAIDLWDIAQTQQQNLDDLVQRVKDAFEEQKQEQDHLSALMSDTAHEHRQYVASAERDKVIEWLSPVNFFPRQADIFSTRQDGTGEWLFEDDRFKAWKSSFGGCLWCHGMPGAGKTVVASLVVNELRAQFQNANIGVACMYLNHKEIEVQSPLNLLASLWRQLVFGKAISLVVSRLYRMHHEPRTRPSLREVHEVLLGVVAEYLQVYIVIDALDEYPEDRRRLLLRHLAAMGPTVNFMLTSRPHISISTFFPNSQALEIRATEQDIQRYVESQIQESSRLSKHVRARPELRDEIEKTIISNAGGMFLLAKLHVESLTTKNNIKAVRETLKNLPKDLDDTYEEAMQRIERQNEDDRNLARLALTWLSNAKRPLSVIELRVALAVEPEATGIDPDSLLDIEIIVSVCAGLIIVDEADDIVRLIHYTTQHYLDRIQTSRFPHAQTEITATCLTYLTFTDPSTPVYKLGKRKKDSDSGLYLPWSTRPFQKHRLLNYAATYCLVHASGQPELALTDKILTCLRVEQTSRWLKFCKYLELEGIYTRNLRSRGELPIAAFFDLREIARYLLGRRRATVERVENAQLFHSLYLASYCGHLEMARLLIEYGADVNMRKGPLFIASEKGHEALVRLLVQNGADVNMQNPERYEWTPLYEVAWNGNKAIAQILIDNGADLNILDKNGSTALRKASAFGHEAVVQLLLDHGADVNLGSITFGEESALYVACLGGHQAVVRLLLGKGADVNIWGGEYGTSLQAAAAHGHEAVVQLLIENGADVNVQGGVYGHGNARQIAEAGGHEGVVRLLLERGFDTDENKIALHDASGRGDEAMVRLLIENGADVNAQRGESGTILQVFSARGNNSIVSFLLEKGADINRQGGYYGNALHAASMEGRYTIALLLLENGANANMQGGPYGNALQAALAEGHEEVAQLLIAWGAEEPASREESEGSPQEAAPGCKTAA